MSYTAKSLEEIAALFDARADVAEKRSGDHKNWTVAARASHASESHTWRVAADVLRRTTLTEPCHMESDAYTARRNA